jgi:hypothetical protein
MRTWAQEIDLNSGPLLFKNNLKKGRGEKSALSEMRAELKILQDTLSHIKKKKKKKRKKENQKANYHQNKTTKHLFLCVWVCLTGHMCRRQKTTCRSQFFPSRIFWGVFQLSGWAPSTFACWAILQFNYIKKKKDLFIYYM